jgi:putative transport protein
MFDWLRGIRETQPVAHGIGVLCLAVALGLLLGGIKVRGIGLGIAGVLFVAILFGHFGMNVDPEVRTFLQEFGLILFVYTIGMQLGPGFVASLRKEGLRLNLLAAGIILGGATLVVAIGLLLRFDVAATAGLFSGATTNTPALGAAQQALETLPGEPSDRAVLPGLAYAVAYPIGIAGIIASILLLKRAFRVDLAAEAREVAAERARGFEAIQRRSIVVENPNLDGLTVRSIPGRSELGVVVSRLKPAGQDPVAVARDDTVVRRGDVLLAVGTAAALDQFQRIAGRRADVDLLSLPSRAIHRRVVVTRSEVLGKSLDEIGLEPLHGVKVTRLSRAGLEMAGSGALRIKFGDRVDLVGDEDGIAKATDALGNSVKALDETQFVPMFLGIALGVLGGLLPIRVPGLPVPVKLGLAGGPLIVAIVLSRVGHAGKLVWHMPANVNAAFRELGITTFLACVGLKAGEKFFGAVFSPTGASWALAALVVTTIPLLVVGFVARKRFGMRFTTLTGLVAGSTTDPPALAFATGVCGSDAPNEAYATVYPLTMILRILAAQLIIVLFG